VGGPGELDDEVDAALASGVPVKGATAIARTLGPGLLGYLVAILHNEGDAREVFSQVLEEILTSIASFRGESSVKTWTYRIAWRTAMRYREAPERRRGRRLETAEVSALAEEARVSTASYQRTEVKDWLARVRATLSPEDQSLLTLRVDRRLSWAEVAEVMGAGDRAADLARLRKRYERIKDELRLAAARDGVVGEGDDG
jgi:RNA polymerase sigma-70 factor (ECF subfamily)